MKIRGKILGHFLYHERATNLVLMLIKTLFIEDLRITENARGQKIGEQLCHFAEEFAQEIGCYNLTLDVWNDNVAALRFYERLDLKPQQTIMEKILKK